MEKKDHLFVEAGHKLVWKSPTLEVLEIEQTMEGGQGIWQYVWDGEFWKLEQMLS